MTRSVYFKPDGVWISLPAAAGGAALLVADAGGAELVGVPGDELEAGAALEFFGSSFSAHELAKIALNRIATSITLIPNRLFGILISDLTISSSQVYSSLNNDI